MKTRDLTTDEQTRLDAAWEQYLTVVSVAIKAVQINVAYSVYKSCMTRLNIIPTLAGYRVKT